MSPGSRKALWWGGLAVLTLACTGQQAQAQVWVSGPAVGVYYAPPPVVVYRPTVSYVTPVGYAAPAPAYYYNQALYGPAPVVTRERMNIGLFGQYNYHMHARGSGFGHYHYHQHDGWLGHYGHYRYHW